MLPSISYYMCTKTADDECSGLSLFKQMFGHYNYSRIEHYYNN